VLPIARAPSAAPALMLALAGHAVSWPFPRGGARAITQAMASHLRALGGTVETGYRLESIDHLPEACAVFLDLVPVQILRVAGHRLPAGYRRWLRSYRYGPGVCKIDLALDGPVPWSNAACRRAATLHLGGSFEEIADGEARVWRGEHPERPYVLVAQHSLFDPTRAPRGRHTVWAYCHVPNGSTVDVSARIEAQIERFAPGFQERILARHVTLPAELERRNANLVGGDVNGGAQTLWQLVARPAPRIDPYRTPVRGLYVCSAATPPGGGVHGLCGHLAASTALAALGAPAGRRRHQARPRVERAGRRRAAAAVRGEPSR
jgi:phytoene dehydrogenase-like protein